MKKLSGDEIRTRFLNFMESKGHLILPSASLVPERDPSLLLIGAGMAPFKRYFTGEAIPPSLRIATSQKCVRTGDLENVGRTARHLTFFEMLGNFSFGEYFKAEAIPWAWEFLTEDLQLPKDRLWISVYTDDDEAYDIWHHKVGIPAERIVRLGKATNFWEIGTGPCGPCSEVYIDLGSERGCGLPSCQVGCDCDRYLEIWNLVFTQFDRDKEGNYTPLPKKNIDTGMGLERLASVLQGVTTNFETDLLFPIIEAAEAVAQVKYGQRKENDVALSVIADHSRAVVYLIGDDVLPANEGRGYVLRRLLRRAVRYGRLLGIKKPFLNQIASVIIKIGRTAYPELAQKKIFIQKVIQQEETRFLHTLDTGLDILAEMKERLTKQKEQTLSGHDAFVLYDTYGFPLDLTKEILAESGLGVDKVGFQQEMDAQRQRARSVRSATTISVEDRLQRLFGDLQSEFVGYGSLVLSDVSIQRLAVDDCTVMQATTGDRVSLVLDRSPFYAEAGGQVGDSGTIETMSEAVVEVIDTKRVASGAIIHVGRVIKGTVQAGDEAVAVVNKERRLAIARHHTATHLLHQALRQVLGDHVRQEGSLVTPERLRFDFSHFRSLTSEEMRAIERLINSLVLEDVALETSIMDRAQAQMLGATALFGDRYGGTVRVVKIGSFSRELCGGTHVDRTGQVGLCRIINEASIGAGLRRIEAVAGMEAWSLWRKQDSLVMETAKMLDTTPDQLVLKIEDLKASLREKEKELARLNTRILKTNVSNLLDKVEEVGTSKLLFAEIEAKGMDDLRTAVDIIR
ncbi:MAG TPA: alanine--tRNA ligase, partial [bacterium]|nr:alanine--tRNA ligase [bacterium]